MLGFSPSIQSKMFGQRFFTLDPRNTSEGDGRKSHRTFCFSANALFLVLTHFPFFLEQVLREFGELGHLFDALAFTGEL